MNAWYSIGIFLELCFIFGLVVIICVKDFCNEHRKTNMICKKCGGEYKIIDFFGKYTNYRRSYECKKCGDLVYAYGPLKKEETDIIANKMIKYMIKEGAEKALKEIKGKVKNDE